MSFLMQLQDVEAAGRLAPFSAAFRAGEIVHLVGPNGAGKSTLLTRMAGLSDGPGTVHFNGRLLDEWPARELARRRGYLSQHQTPPFAMPVWHYLALHMQQQGDSARLSDIAARLGLDNKLGRPVNQLSGGDCQWYGGDGAAGICCPLPEQCGQWLDGADYHAVDDVTALSERFCPRYALATGTGGKRYSYVSGKPPGYG